MLKSEMKSSGGVTGPLENWLYGVPWYGERGGASNMTNFIDNDSGGNK